MNRSQAAAAQVLRWNERVPVGAAVSVRRDDGSTLETTTRSEAWVTEGGQPLVKVHGIAGGYLLERVTPDAGLRLGYSPCPVCGANVRTTACDAEACGPTTEEA